VKRKKNNKRDKSLKKKPAAPNVSENNFEKPHWAKIVIGWLG
jgi:hypothetical protein